MSIPSAPPLPEKLFSSISDVSAINASYDLHRTLEKTKLFKENYFPLKESSLPNMTCQKKDNIQKKIELSLNNTNKLLDRFNSLDLRPFNSLKNPIIKHEKNNNYCKALISFKKQNSTFSKFFIVQNKALFNDQIVNNRNNYLFGETALPKLNDKNNNFNTQKSFNSKSEKCKKGKSIVN